MGFVFGFIDASHLSSSKGLSPKYSTVQCGNPKSKKLSASLLKPVPPESSILKSGAVSSIPSEPPCIPESSVMVTLTISPGSASTSIPP